MNSEMRMDVCVNNKLGTKLCFGPHKLIHFYFVLKKYVRLDLYVPVLRKRSLTIKVTNRC